MLTDKNKIEILSTLCTRDEDGVHFTRKFIWSDLYDLEADGYIEILRPIHEGTGIMYSPDWWQVEILEKGIEYIDQAMLQE